ncbi:MAG TPA: SSI family serine proteinase inhibitor [Streptosporangiaceae bacterium]|nr:SSI family serine proteinase inhibitor [Streptosporangiaceae bacterium]
MAMTPLPDVALTAPAAGRRGALPMRTTLAGAVALLTGALLAACGSTAAPSSGGAGSGSTGSTAAGSHSAGTSSAGTSSAGTSSAGTTPAAKVSLDVTFAVSTNSPARHYTLQCEPAGGTTPDPAAACARLLASPSIFGSRPLHVMCPMMLANPARATLTGNYFGEAVRLTIINGGCDVSRWTRLKVIFG